jgi:hypothetical protein
MLSESYAGMRRAAVEVVPETVIAAIYLLHERSVGEVAAKLRPDELEHVIRLVGRCPSCYPPGTLEALKIRSPAAQSFDTNSGWKIGRAIRGTPCPRFRLMLLSSRSLLFTPPRFLATPGCAL